MRYEVYDLQHSGVRGMRWGVRRYQNADGTLTDAGKKRYKQDVRDNLSRTKKNRIDTSEPDARRWVREDLKRVKSTTDAASGVVKTASSVEQRLSSTTKNNTPSKKELSSLSDKELRDMVNRAMLERQYTALYAEQHPVEQSKGRQYAKEVLSTTGTVLGIAGSAVSLAIALNELKN